MNRYIILSLCLGLLIVAVDGPISAGASGAPGPEPAAPSAGGGDLSAAEASRALDLIFNGRPRYALAYLDSLERRSRGEPLFHIMRARCHQELIPMDDANSGAARRISRPALDELDRCIEVCTARLDEGSEESMLYFYRGWAWMAKAYVRSMTRDLFTAGREAKRGKKDLERYLRSHPGDPTATGMLGAFLYFADTIPGAFKLLSKILFLPSGDRTRGLAYLENAAQRGGLLETDWKLILYNVYFYFEGRFEDGIDGLRDMIALHPGYVRTAIPLALSRPYAPRFSARNDELVQETVSRVHDGPSGEIDWNGLYLLQVFRAYGDRYCNDTGTTIATLQKLIDDSPTHPDWVAGFARLELGRIYASQGRRDDALAMFESVTSGCSFEFLRKEARDLIEDIGRFASSFEGASLPDIDGWVTALYRGGPDSIRAVRPRFEKLSPRSVAARFYLAECDLLSGDLESARTLFDEVLSVEAPAWDHAYQLISATRIAEIYASRAFYKTAARYQDVAMRYYHSEYLLDWVLEGRKKHFERLSDGKADGPPALLMGSTARREGPRTAATSAR